MNVMTASRTRSRRSWRGTCIVHWTYFWLPQRRGFIRNSLNARRWTSSSVSRAQYGLLQPSKSYYRSSYVFVSRRDRHVRIDSFDAPLLKGLTIGIQIGGDDYNNPLAAQELASRHIVENVRGFMIYGDYSLARILNERLSMPWLTDASTLQSSGVRWQATTRSASPCRSTSGRSRPRSTDRRRGSRSISRWVSVVTIRRCAALDSIITRRADDIRRILHAYGVPLQ